jgi:hypothetical protein
LIKVDVEKIKFMPKEYKHMKHNLRTLLAAVIITAALTTLFLLALAGETETTTASYSYQADTAVEEGKNPAETAGDVENTHKPEPTVPETTVPETEVPVTTVPETTSPETTAPETSKPDKTGPSRLQENEVALITWATMDYHAAVASGRDVRFLALPPSTIDDGRVSVLVNSTIFWVEVDELILSDDVLWVYFVL